MIRLEVADDGRGLPKDFDVQRPSGGSLGTRLIAGFTRQVGGTLQVLSDGTGARFVLDMPGEPARD